MITALQVLFALFIIVLIILLVFKPRRKENVVMPDNYQELLRQYVPFYNRLNEGGKKAFEEKFEHFLTAVRINGANAEVEDLDRVLIGAAAVIPVFYIPDWEYINLREVLLYPGSFNSDFDQKGNERYISGMVGTGHMQNVMILSKWELRQGFINGQDSRNVAIHEFVHLIDKMDGSLDGIPEILLERKYKEEWLALMEMEMMAIRNGQSDIDAYGATAPVECFAVMAEYFFEQPEVFSERHPQLAQMMKRIFMRGSN
jgi:MtfA peptidase